MTGSKNHKKNKISLPTQQNRKNGDLKMHQKNKISGATVTNGKTRNPRLTKRTKHHGLHGIMLKKVREGKSKTNEIPAATEWSEEFSDVTN